MTAASLKSALAFSAMRSMFAHERSIVVATEGEPAIYVAEAVLASCRATQRVPTLKLI